MFTRMSRPTLTMIALLIGAAPAHAQLAVVDIPAFAQLIQEVQTMAQEVQTAENQLAQARQALATMTGSRGMQQLLAGTPRNYLPTNWQQLTMVMQGGTAGLPAVVQNAIIANAVLSSRQLSMLSAGDRQEIAARRESGALQQGLVQQALANVSGRFAAVQTLIDAIATATDQKGILDLQARINAELGMLENEQTKLQVLSQAIQAQAAIETQRERESLIAGHGSFAARFQPRL